MKKTISAGLQDAFKKFSWIQQFCDLDVLDSPSNQQFPLLVFLVPEENTIGFNYVW